MIIVYCQDKTTCDIRETDGSLESMQKLVDGFIQPVYLSNSLCVIVNEEGLLRGMPFNRFVAGQPLYGPLFFIRTVGADFAGIPYKTAVELLKLVA